MAIPIDEVLTIHALRLWRMDKTKLASGAIGQYKTHGWQERRQTMHDARLTRVIDLERAMSQLSEEDKQALILAYADDQPHATIAAFFGVCNRTVYARLILARRRLADVLGRLGLI
jgi:DNA-directed RNA polymerase specialized sigma24 family protein